MVALDLCEKLIMQVKSQYSRFYGNTNWAFVKLDEIKSIAKIYETFEFSYLPMKQSFYPKH